MLLALIAMRTAFCECVQVSLVHTTIRLHAINIHYAILFTYRKSERERCLQSLWLMMIPRSEM